MGNVKRPGILEQPNPPNLITSRKEFSAKPMLEDKAVRESVEGLSNIANLNDIDLRLVRNSQSKSKREQEKSAGGLTKMAANKES